MQYYYALCINIPDEEAFVVPLPEFISNGHTSTEIAHI